MILNNHTTHIYAMYIQLGNDIGKGIDRSFFKTKKCYGNVQMTKMDFNVRSITYGSNAKPKIEALILSEYWNSTNDYTQQYYE